MAERARKPEFETGDFVRDVCWLGEDHPEFRDDYPLAFPADPPEGSEASGTAASSE